MKQQARTYMNWSSGKDAAFALYHLQQQGIVVDSLLTSVNQHHDRISMHGVRRVLLETQAAATGIPLRTIELPEMPDMAAYEQQMKHAVRALLAEGFNRAAFGDIFLEDLRRYREQQLAPYGISTLFPLWQQDTRALLLSFIDQGFKAVTVCINSGLLDRSFCGRLIDRDFLESLPAGIDPCGENGEFHTFCFDGPVFRQAVPFVIGGNVYREYAAPGDQGKIGFWFCDLLPV